MSLAIGVKSAPRNEQRMGATIPRGGLGMTAPREVVSTKIFETRMAKRLQEQVQHETLSTYHSINKRLAANNLSDDRVSSLRRLRRFQQQNSELLLGHQLDATKQEEESRRLLAEQDRQLAAAIAHEKNEKLAEERSAQRIIAASDDLQELRAKLRAAELNAQRSAQLEEKELDRSREKSRQAALDAAMEFERQKSADRAAEDRQAKEIRLKEGKRILESQMAEREYRKQLAYAAFLREKAVVDEVVRGIEEDDKEKLKKAGKKRAELQENIKIFLEQRALWREEEKKKAESELSKIRLYQQAQQQRYEELLKQKKEKKRE